MKLEGADYEAVQAECGNPSRYELTQNLSANSQPQSSQVTEPLWTDPGLKIAISVSKLISTLKKKKKQQWNMNGRTFSRNPCQQGKSQHTDAQRFFVSVVCEVGVSTWAPLFCHKNPVICVTVQCNMMFVLANCQMLPECVDVGILRSWHVEDLAC